MVHVALLAASVAADDDVASAAPVDPG